MIAPFVWEDFAMRLKIVCVVLSLAFGSFADSAELRILAVGNSFSGNALRYFGDLVKASGNRVVVGHAMIGGCDFERHMRHADAFEANPSGAEGRPYANGQSLRDLLVTQRWDFVTIQQASPKSFRPETYHPHADRLIAYVKKYAPQAEIVIHQTWAYRDDHRWFKEPEKNPGQPADHAAMYAAVRTAYDAFATQSALRLVPCGDAMELARLDPAWGPFAEDPAFDAKTAVFPALPAGEKRALQNGYSWKMDTKTGRQSLGKDAFHANATGEYLLGCVWLEFFFKTSAVGNAFLPKGVNAEDAAVMQRVAHRAVTEKQRP
jgi:hypothetical protein